jgi:hypothetical protein
MIVVAVVYPAWLRLAFIRSCARWRCSAVMSFSGTPFLGDMLAGMKAQRVHSHSEASASRHALSGIANTPCCFCSGVRLFTYAVAAVVITAAARWRANVPAVHRPIATIPVTVNTTAR